MSYCMVHSGEAVASSLSSLCEKGQCTRQWGMLAYYNDKYQIDILVIYYLPLSVTLLSVRFTQSKHAQRWMFRLWAGGQCTWQWCVIDMRLNKTSNKNGYKFILGLGCMPLCLNELGKWDWSNWIGTTGLILLLLSIFSTGSSWQLLLLSLSFSYTYLYYISGVYVCMYICI